MLTDSNLVGYATFKLLIYTLKAEALSKKRKKKKKLKAGQITGGHLIIIKNK